MCRNITTLRGLEPPATGEEIEAAARQYVRKVSGVTRPTPATEAAFEQAVAAVARAPAAVLGERAPRRHPPSAVMINRASRSWIRALSASAENPPNTTLWITPIRAHASARGNSVADFPDGAR